MAMEIPGESPGVWMGPKGKGEGGHLGYPSGVPNLPGPDPLPLIHTAPSKHQG